MRIYLHLLAAFFLFFAGSIYANTQQEKRVTGTVTSEGEPLPGVSVQLKGASSGTITDIDGNYSIEAPVNGTLVFRFVGMKTVEQPVNNRNVINVTLDSESKELEEVMVVAYATAKKYSFTGAASTMKAGEIEKLQTSSVSRVLEGTVSGVQASAASGQPGTDAEIRIRGIGSINASSAPLYVVDGVPFDGSVNSINPDDISSMTVLKDAASAALYGSRGANGVIIITTKQGQQDSKATVKVKASLGGSNRAVRDYDRVSTNQYFELYWEALRNQYAKSSDYTSATAAAQASKDLVTKLMGGGPNPYGPQYAQPVGTDGKLVAGARPLWDSDWSDAMEQQALRTELNLSVSGGGKANQYFFSAGYLNDKGIALESGYQRFNLRSNITSEITSWLKGGVNLSFAHSMQNYPVSSDSKTSNVITAGRTMPGFYPIYEMNADGSYKLDDSGNRIYDFGSYRPSGSMANWNLPATLPLDKSERMKDEVSGRTFLEATIIEGLKFKTSFNFDLINYNTLDYTNPKLEGTASGNYTSAASSGVSAPSVALKNTGEYLQTPRYNEGIVKFSFMYRFASSGTGSYIVVEKESDNSWTAIDTLRYVDTSKNYPEYTFSIEEHVTSVKVVYVHKEKGNVAVDDASITYGAYVKDIFSQEKVGNITTHVIEGLSPQTEYGYQVRSVCKDVVSNWSSVQRAVTADISAVTSVRSCDPLVYVSGRQIIIATLCGSERISVYNLSGQVLYAVAAKGKNQIAINVDRGIYIIKIEARNKIFNKKIIL